MPNRLASSASPYLRQHADNPVDWMPWGEEAFARARAEGKPIFLSIGYATCHWCHVMARESFEDAGIAEALNRDFVCVKVDREERPDVDRVYMTYVQAMSGRGGWPLSVWLTPELKPFYGGTYFPPDDRHGRPGFLRIVGALARGWATDHAEFTGEAARAYETLGAHLAEHAIAARSPLAIDEATVEAVYQKALAAFNETYDSAKGGFGGAPKFPQPGNLRFLLRMAARGGDDGEALGMASATLAHMGRGGIHDHVGGGFHRYSVDEDWFVPHFEKMLYDQAQLASASLEAAAIAQDDRYAWLARDVIDYVLRDLGSPDGGFFSAEDADSEPAGSPGEHREGAFYLWDWDELHRVLGSDADLVCDHFGARPGGNVPPGSDPQGEFTGLNLLAQARPLGDTAERHGLGAEAAVARVARALPRLRAARARRPRPLCDRKIVCAWNGLMLSALARGAGAASPVFAELWRTDDGEARGPGTAACLQAARRCTDFLRRTLRCADGSLLRSWCDGVAGAPAVAEDYAFLIQGLLDLHEADLDVRWLEWALELQGRFDEQFLDEHGGYFNSHRGAGDLILRLKEDYDGAEPAASSVAALNLLRLAALFDREDLRSRALLALAAFRSRWEAVPQAMPTLLLALEWAALPAPRKIVLRGDPADPAFRALAEVSRAAAGPGVRLALTPQTEAWWCEKLAWLRALPGETQARPVAYLCRDFVCEAPVAEPAALRALL